MRDNGRLYHPSPVGPRALVRSALAVELLRDAVPHDTASAVSLRWRDGRAIAVPVVAS